VTTNDALAFTNALDDRWHGASRSFEREAITRFWGLLTLPARALDPEGPRRLLDAATVLRNARFTGTAVQDMFFEDQSFTEVDAVFLNVGSPLGHPVGEDAWVVEVERKTGHHQGDYFRAMHRAKQFAQLLARRFGVRARPVVVYEDDGGKLSYKTFDGEVLLIRMSSLRDRTAGLSFSSLLDIPGMGCDRTLVKLGLLRHLVKSDPRAPGGPADGLAFARAVEADGWPLRLPVVGHQNVESLGTSLARWLGVAREGDEHLASKIVKYCNEMVEAGLLDQGPPEPRLTLDGGQVVLEAMRFEAEVP